MGVLMPHKKFLPLSLMPLELELTLNPHALIVVENEDNPNLPRLDRSYQMSNIELWGHTLFFE